MKSEPIITMKIRVNVKQVAIAKKGQSHRGVPIKYVEKRYMQWHFVFLSRISKIVKYLIDRQEINIQGSSVGTRARRIKRSEISQFGITFLLGGL